jgi:hypothetical protein
VCYCSPTPGSDNAECAAVGEEVGSLVITEVNFNPCEAQGSDDQFEYFEIYNPGPGPFAFGGASLSQGVEFTFPDDASLAAGEYALVAKDSATMNTLVPAGTQVWQWTSGGTSNGGEDIQIDLNGEILDFVDYDDNAPWDDVSGGDFDGGCFSLELSDVTADNGDSNNAGGFWGQGCTIYGTPGFAGDFSCW